MELNAAFLTETALFNGIANGDMPPLLACLSAQTIRCEKNQTILHRGDRLERFGIVLEGQFRITEEDYFGNRHLLAALEPGDLFGESFAFAQAEALPFDVVAASDSTALLIDCRRLTQPCAKACGFHSRLIQNLMSVISGKNIVLTQKIGILSKRSTREKLLAYLAGEARRHGSRRFNIPFDRQGLADYLCVERSALSAELSKLRSQGILDFQKNHFELAQNNKRNDGVIEI